MDCGLGSRKWSPHHVRQAEAVAICGHSVSNGFTGARSNDMPHRGISVRAWARALPLFVNPIIIMGTSELVGSHAVGICPTCPKKTGNSDRLLPA
jgi:hypothetical protein